MSEATLSKAVQPTRHNQWRSSAWRSLSRDPTGLVSLLTLSLLILLALLAPILAPFDPTVINYDALLQPPNSTYWFGTDQLGRDLFSRVLWGGRESLRVSFLGVAVALTGGTVIGLISGYYGGWVEATLMRIVDIWLAFPIFLLLLSLVAILGLGLSTIIIALGLSSLPGYARLVRGSVLAVKQAEYIVAARAVGAPNWRILARHILPNIVGVLIVYSAAELGSAMVLGTGLSFLGLGAQPPSPEWGAMLNAGLSFLREAWWLTGFPGLAIFMAALCINLLGDTLRDALAGHRQ